MTRTPPVRLGQGFYWEDLRVGDRFCTPRRTITEADLINFISATGMLEEMFIDAGSRLGAAAHGRLAPAALTYCFIEGFILQTMIQGTGMAMLEASMKAVAPVFVGDTIEALVEVTSVRPTSKADRAIVDSDVTVTKLGGGTVLQYSIRRMLAGRGG